MQFPQSFYRSAAVCSWISAVTTCMLIFLPRFYAPLEGFEGRMISSEAGGPGLPSALDPWVYPTIQPLARTLIGVWLWRNAANDPAPPDRAEPLVS